MKIRSLLILGLLGAATATAQSGSATTNSSTAGWAGKLPGSMWSVSANCGYQRLNRAAARSGESWRATGGIARLLGTHMFFNAQYAYFTFRSNVEPLSVAVLDTQSGVSVALSWSPSQ